MALRYELVDTHHPEWRGQRFGTEARAKREQARSYPKGRFIIKDRQAKGGQA